MTMINYAASLVPILVLLAPYWIALVLFCRFILSLTTSPEQCDNQQQQFDQNSKRCPPSTRQKVALGLHGLVLAIVLSPCSYYFPWMTGETQGLHDLIQGTDPSLQQILEQVPSIQRGPTPPLFFINRHLQFLPWLIQNELHRIQGIPFQRIEIEVTACPDKTQPGSCGTTTASSTSTAQLHMKDTITLDIFPPLTDEGSEFTHNFDKSSPVILFAPGLRCYSQDLPGNMIIRKAYAEGFRSVVINRRGHTPGMPLRSPRWNLFGDIDDMEQVYWYIKRHLVHSDTPMFLHGISSGTSVTVSALSAWDKRRSEARNGRNLEEAVGVAPSFVASISVTPGYDISRVMRPDRFGFPYNLVLTHFVKQHFVVQNEDLLRSYNSDAVDATLAAATLQEFVDAAAPFAGYPNASAYYQGENPINEVRHITTPKFVLNAVDDPCCKIDNLYEVSPYPHHNGYTYAEMVSQSKRGIVAVTKTGSHCPFLDGSFLPITKDPLYGGWMLNSWADQVSIEYYRAALEVYGGSA